MFSRGNTISHSFLRLSYPPSPSSHRSTSSSSSSHSFSSFRGVVGGGFLLLLFHAASCQTASDELSFSIKAPVEKLYVQESGNPKFGARLELVWKLDYGDYTINDFVYTINHKFKRVNGGEGMNHISKEYPTECPPTVGFGPSHCGMPTSHFTHRLIMHITSLSDEGYEALVVSISNVTLADFNVDPDRKADDIPAEKMKFEATMHCAVRNHIGEKRSSTIEVSYTRGDPNKIQKQLNKEQENINYGQIAWIIAVVVIVLLIALILFAKRKSIKSCLKPEKPRNKDQIEVEAVKSNGENEKLAQQQQPHESLQHEQQDLV